ncbi:MAG: hypothetical protein HGA54_07005 [Actinobacteria bacterium]|nr:hypothetical protein [Actinomycetota bacterium]
MAILQTGYFHLTAMQIKLEYGGRLWKIGWMIVESVLAATSSDYAQALSGFERVKL